MGQFGAVSLFISVLLYMVLMFVITSALISHAGGDITISGNSTVESSLTLADGFCAAPRERATLFDSFNGLSCNSIPAAEQEATCNEISGCGWVNETTSFLLFTSPAACEGYINVTDYDPTATVSPTGVYVTDPEFCELSGLDTDRRTCELFGCSWVNAEELQITATSGFSTVTSTFGALAGFRADIIGLSGLLAFMYSMFAFYIPLVLLILAIYYMIPVIH